MASDPRLESEIPDGLEEFELTRCDPDRSATCYRPGRVDKTWLRSTDGGITWSPTTTEPMGSLEAALTGLVCVTDDHCFRGLFEGDRVPFTTMVGAPNPAKGWRSGIIEETSDGGSSWH